MKTNDALRTLHALAAYETHGGYSWAAVTSDGALLCVTCVREHYRQIFRATQESDQSGWAVDGITHSGEAEETEYCSHCNAEVWNHE